MEMILMPADKVREMMIEAASIALKYNQPPAIPAAPADELLTPDETAKLLKVTKVTIWDWEKRGILQKHHIGNQVRYLRSEVLEAVLKRGKVITLPTHSQEGELLPFGPVKRQRHNRRGI